MQIDIPYLVLGSITNETLVLGKGNKRRSSSVALIVGDDFNTFILPDSNTGVSGSKINSNGGHRNNLGNWINITYKVNEG